MILLINFSKCTGLTKPGHVCDFFILFIMDSLDFHPKAKLQTSWQFLEVSICPPITKLRLPYSCTSSSHVPESWPIQVFLRLLSITFDLWKIGGHTTEGSETLKYAYLQAFWKSPTFSLISPSSQQKESYCLVFTKCGETWMYNRT